jgi:hypothetical protein
VQQQTVDVTVQQTRGELGGVGDEAEHQTLGVVVGGGGYAAKQVVEGGGRP